jgi:hypothetical protein
MSEQKHQGIVAGDTTSIIHEGLELFTVVVGHTESMGVRGKERSKGRSEAIT